MQNIVDTHVKPSGPIVAPPAAAATHAEAWLGMRVGDIDTQPLPSLLDTLGVRLIEVEPAELAEDGITGYMFGRVGDAEIQISRDLPQAEREPIVRSLLARIGLKDRTATEPQTPRPRMRAAKVNGAALWIHCPAWCTADHLADNVRFLEDVVHMGDHVDLTVPRNDDKPEHLAHAYVSADPFGSTTAARLPFITFDDESGQDFSMTPAQAEDFADNLVAFAEQVRGLARTARSQA